VPARSDKEVYSVCAERFSLTARDQNMGEAYMIEMISQKCLTQRIASPNTSLPAMTMQGPAQAQGSITPDPCLPDRRSFL
jgi:hypothetical protein